MSATIQTITLTAPDISCGHCEQTIRTEVGALSGVEQVDASAATKLVTVAFDPSTVSLETIAQTLDEAGYPVQP